MEYSTLVNIVDRHTERNILKTRWDVVAYLIGYQGQVDANDFDNIERLYVDGFID